MVTLVRFLILQLDEMEEAHIREVEEMRKRHKQAMVDLERFLEKKHAEARPSPCRFTSRTTPLPL